MQVLYFIVAIRVIIRMQNFKWQNKLSNILKMISLKNLIRLRTLIQIEYNKTFFNYSKKLKSHGLKITIITQMVCRLC